MGLLILFKYFIFLSAYLMVLIKLGFYRFWQFFRVEVVRLLTRRTEAAGGNFIHS